VEYYWQNRSTKVYGTQKSSFYLDRNSVTFYYKDQRVNGLRGIIGVYYESYTQHTNTSYFKFQRFLKAELGCKILRLFVRFMKPFGFISGYQRLGETCYLCFPQSRLVTAGSSETLATDTKVTLAI
jgi:hypothetical protein